MPYSQRPGGLSIVKAAFAGLILFALASCASSRGGSIPYEPADFGAPDPQSAQLLDADYRISPLDTLKIGVFQVPDLSGEYEVDLTGQIALPLIGNVKAVDMTTAQLQQDLTSKFGETYLRDPKVTVGITKSAGSNITVDGSVNSPGVFPVAGRITLVQAIAMARGTDDTANERRIAVFRTIDGQRMAAAFDLIDIRRGEAEDPAIYRGDIIIVDGSSTRRAFRDLIQSMPLVRIFTPTAF
jgi:polysaccharide export outer membrane protein